MAGKITIERLDGTTARASYVRHVRTLAHGDKRDDVDVFRLDDGTEIECMYPTHDSRVNPREVDPTLDHYPGYPPGV